jgi:hypothetical protein
MDANCGCLPTARSIICVLRGEKVCAEFGITGQHSLLSAQDAVPLSAFSRLVEIFSRSLNFIAACMHSDSYLARTVAQYFIQHDRYSSFLGHKALFCA